VSSQIGEGTYGQVFRGYDKNPQDGTQSEVSRTGGKQSEKQQVAEPGWDVFMQQLDFQLPLGPVPF
jgi:hypothetical protein